ncbi:MAG TPA: hypothetical protein P5519_08525 [Spirochaetia bacterium]|nr:hypothetical protein [Spirochaetales bacterium]HQK33624.1 hypothetical protein [Spirochaetales bacterium]HRS65917.1 hypothetical protein [Spirochaetia bacterium]HRV29270.1 hypothetical protein [Spirochaetia bacterium]
MKVLSKCLIIVFVLILSACITFGPDTVLVQEVPDEYKSQTLTNYGVELYKTELIKNNNYAELERIRTIFQAAVDLNPANTTAKQYLLLIDDYKNKHFENFVLQAQNLQKKAKRTDDETYAMLFAIEQARTFDAKDKRVQELLKQTAEIKKDYIATSLLKINELRETAKNTKKDSERETAIIKAFTLVERVTNIDSSNFDANRAYQELKSEIEKIVKAKLDQAKALRIAQKFDQAVAFLSAAKDLNTKMDNAFTVQIKDEEYNLYYAWARYHEQRKEWQLAAQRISKALTIKKTADAQNLQKRVAEAQGEQIRSADFTAALQAIDNALNKGDLVNAFTLIITRLKITTDTTERSTLEERKKRIYDSLKTYYERGVQAYREERFKDAIAALTIVVSIDPDYLDAADYLEKAKQKQALLEQYGGS